MGALLGAIKGIWRGTLLLLAAVLVPGIAWVGADHAEDFLGLGFTTAFLIALALGAFLGLAGLFGIASEVQQRHSDALDRAASGRRPS